ncbi:MAG: hypothetical protein EP319_01585 [Deltaproteobacteria bacterium]|nr:MAG: hypothetical protein EP319_01585 [Deltaproteobacteria bacterium]
MKDQSKLIHDINSGLSSLSQAIELIDTDNTNTELLSQITPLALEKITQVLADWEELKNQIRE